MTEFINSKLNESAFVIRQNHRAQLPKQGVSRVGSGENLACFGALSRCGALAIAGALLLLWMPALWRAEAEAAEQANGLHCHQTAVSPDSVDEAPEPSNPVNSFANDNAVTFAVELRNMSDQPITLLDAAGRLNTQQFGPYLFEFDFTDAEGNPVPRAERTIFGDGTALQGAAAKELAPGESLTVLLRPAGFMRPMNYDLPPGQYRARVRYHGPSQSALSLIKQHWPESRHAKAWTGEVESNAVAFSVAQDSNESKAAQLIWGPEKDGLRAAIAYQLPEGTEGDPAVAPGVPVGTKVGIVFDVQNVSDRVITFVSEAARQDDWIHVTDSDGEEVHVKVPFYWGWPIDVRWKLNPGESAQLPVLEAGLDSINTPGEYSVRYTIRFGSRQSKDKDGKVVFPPPGDWQDDLETGVAPLFLTSRPTNAEVQEQAPRLQVRVAHRLGNQGENAAAKNAGDKNLLSWSPANTDTEWLLLADAAPLFTERDVESVEVKSAEGSGDWRHTVAISLTEAAGERMKSETAELLQNGIDPNLRVVVLLDGKVLVAPRLMNVIGRQMELSGIRDRSLVETLVNAATARSAAHDDFKLPRTSQSPPAQ